jgi:hypothetical protein
MELDEGDSISGTLGTFEHKSAPEYIAQSYVCGEGECDFKITVNGGAHYIQPNLSIALLQTKRALQDRESGEESDSWTQTTWLWIDAICIHQSNVAEREMQIKFMEHIYRGASMTFISLGKRTESQRLLAGFFQWLDDDANTSRLQGEEGCHSTDRDGARIIDAATTQRSSLEWPCELQAEFDMSGEDARGISDELRSPHAKRLGQVNPYPQALNWGHPFWLACMELFEADWFSRLWTFQELWLSRHPYFTLYALLPWGKLELLPDRIAALDRPHDDLLTAVTLGRRGKFLNQALSLQYHKNEKITDDIWTLLAITATKRAKLPKDHVFAILGLMDADTQRLIDVNYSKTDAQVFQDTLQSAMRSTTAAQILPRHWETFASVPTTTPSLPSWVPDLNNKTNARVPYGYMLGHAKTVSSAFDDSAQLRVSLSPENGLIFLNVLKVDVVSMPGGETLELPRAFDEILGWIKGLYNNMTSGEDELPALKERLRNFFAAIAKLSKEEIAVLFFLMEMPQLVMEGFTFEEIVLHVRQGLHPIHELRQEIFEITNAGPDHKTLLESLHFIAPVSLWVVFKTSGSRYIFTTLGGRVGCSPKPVSPGDRICIVPGGDYLHVFSTAPSRYITCATVHGLNGDDLPDIVRELGREFEEIAIH